jgi:hypothetical protein
VVEGWCGDWQGWYGLLHRRYLMTGWPGEAIVVDCGRTIELSM